MRRRQPEVASMTAEEKAISEKEKRERRNKRRRERYAERKKDPAETEKMSKLQAERPPSSAAFTRSSQEEGIKLTTKNIKSCLSWMIIPGLNWSRQLREGGGLSILIDFFFYHLNV